jgi:hypothetical protein
VFLEEGMNVANMIFKGSLAVGVFLVAQSAMAAWGPTPEWCAKNGNPPEWCGQHRIFPLAVFPQNVQKIIIARVN